MGAREGLSNKILRHTWSHLCPPLSTPPYSYPPPPPPLLSIHLSYSPILDQKFESDVRLAKGSQNGPYKNYSLRGYTCLHCVRLSCYPSKVKLKWLYGAQCY